MTSTRNAVQLDVIEIVHAPEKELPFFVSVENEIVSAFRNLSDATWWASAVIDAQTGFWQEAAERDNAGRTFWTFQPR